MQKLDGKKQVDLDVSTLENGIYFIIISTDNESQINISKKIMVMR
jgi:ABC-type Fe3+/spermidine/putrescine transport system ATPase subunit